ncbi:MAG: L-threonylcarbamoyladenylate synthase [Candidatus Omnitrophota bacterium]
MITEVIKINNIDPDLRVIEKAARVLRDGDLVAFATETVYGVGANMLDRAAVEQLYNIKMRPKEKPFTIHIAIRGEAERYAANISLAAYKLMNKFWPGPLTIVLPAKEKAAKTIGLRMPEGAVAQRILSLANFPVVVPSANNSGSPVPKTAEEVLRDLDGKIALLLDSGPAKLGIASTVVDAAGDEIRILRAGAIRDELIFAVCRRRNILFVCTGNSCRSPLAEGLLKRICEIEHLYIEVESAGIGAPSGMPATAFAQQVAAEHDIDISNHYARMLTEDMLKKTDIIFVMEEFHRERILERFPEMKKRIYLLTELSGETRNISDPIGRAIEVYRNCFREIEGALEVIVKKIKNGEI